MKAVKQRLACLLLAFIILALFSSCAMLNETAALFRPDSVDSDVQIDGITVRNWKNYEDPAVFDVEHGEEVSIRFSSNEFYHYLREADLSNESAILIVRYDKRFVDFVYGRYYPNYDLDGFLEARGEMQDESEAIYAVVPGWINFMIRDDAPSGTTTITGEFVRRGYGGHYTEIESIELII